MSPHPTALAPVERSATSSSLPAPELDALIDYACSKIAPTWPLDRFIAVNPLCKLTGAPLPEVAAALRSLSGAELLMPRAWYREAYRDGRLRDEHLASALRARGSALNLSYLRALLEQETPPVLPRPRVADVLDAERDLTHEPSWRGFVTHSVSQFCAAYFDEGQAAFAPPQEGGLYVSWRRHAVEDRSPALLMGASAYRKVAAGLPSSAREMVSEGLTALDIPTAERGNYLWCLLLDQNGWASWCAYRRWVAHFEGKDDDALEELLAIRMAWEWMLHRLGGGALDPRWRAAMASWPTLDARAAKARADDWLLQDALEQAWREPVMAALQAGLGRERPSEISVQAVFCIDVRSEVLRRALEAASPRVQTLGFAGFFGLPIDYQPLGSATARPQLPGLAAPRFRVVDDGLGPDAPARRARQLNLASAWRAFKGDALSTFTFVEALGLTYAGKLLKDGFGLGQAHRVEEDGLSSASRAHLKPRLVGPATGTPLELQTRAELAAGMLRGMSLTHDFARLVLLAGHGSTSCNNPHAAGLNCGACGGQSGAVNARVAAALLNDPLVRGELARLGLHVPEGTRFLAGLHDTTTDDVELFDLDELPASHQQDLDTLRDWLAAAGDRARAERGERLGLEPEDPVSLGRSLRARARDWSQVRAEWGLARNAAFIVAPREHCRHVDLRGRAFLHEYRHREDVGYATLELILTAPLLVTHWINFQYYASTVDNARYGSGNKVLHNVVGGHLGVFEGNGGDLRLGLPLQSLHDGERWVHEPLRLSVFLEAPRPAIDAILAKHETVRDLVTKGWVELLQLDEEEQSLYTLQGGQWRRLVPR